MAHFVANYGKEAKYFLKLRNTEKIEITRKTFYLTFVTVKYFILALHFKSIFPAL